MPIYRVDAKRIIDCQLVIMARTAKAALKKAETGDWEYIDDFDAEVVPSGNVELDADATREADRE